MAWQTGPNRRQDCRRTETAHGRRVGRDDGVRRAGGNQLFLLLAENQTETVSAPGKILPTDLEIDVASVDARRPAARRAAGPATGSRPPLRRERSRSARVVNGRLRHTGEDPFRRAPPCVVSRVSFYVLHTPSQLAATGTPRARARIPRNADADNCFGPSAFGDG